MPSSRIRTLSPSAARAVKVSPSEIDTTRSDSAGAVAVDGAVPGHVHPARTTIAATDVNALILTAGSLAGRAAISLGPRGEVELKFY